MPLLELTQAYAAVILDDALDKTLDYAIPEEMIGKIEPGMRVAVPLRKGIRRGTVLTLKERPDVAKTVPISHLLSDRALIPSELMTLSLWMSRHYASPLSQIVKSILPPPIREGMKEKVQLFVKPLLSKNEIALLCEKLVRKRAASARVLDEILKAPSGIFLSELLEKSGSSASCVRQLEKEDVLQLLEMSVDRAAPLAIDFFSTSAKHLSAEQQICLDAINSNLHKAAFKTFLLHGITGSGKTEVYMQAMELALQLGKSVIMLVPEIALTSQTMERLSARFQQRIAILHCRLSEGEKRDTWEMISQGKIQIVVGARSALFSPVQNLGLIIVDEEHESSYKQQEEAPCYHARDLCVMRGKLVNATVVLGSATPTLESYTNALSGKYELLELKERPKNALLPKSTIVDMRREYEQNGGYTLFSQKLLDGIKKRLELGEQIILFLNRRGYHTTQVCGSCGEAVGCPHCSVSLTFHRSQEKLCCHLCGYEIAPPPRSCTACKSENTMRFKGVGTEQVERAIHALFDGIRTLRLDADTTRHKGSHEKLLRQFKSGKADLLIGTQMIAKGLHFPACTLVGILNADSSLHIPDFRASEQMFQLITQVSGRSGRSELQGEVVIQTMLPENETILFAAKGDYLNFYNSEITSRKFFNYPPYSHFVKLTFTGKDERKTESLASRFREMLLKKLPDSFELQPVSPSGYAKIKDLYRFNCLIKGPLTAPVTAAYLELKPLFTSARITIDVDPTSTFF